MKRALVLAPLVFAAAATATAAAQSGNRLPIQFQVGGDSVYSAMSGGTFTAVVVSSYDNSGLGADSFAVRMQFDATRFAFVAAQKLCSDQAAPLNVTPGSGVVDVSTASCNSPYYGERLFQITFRLAPAAVDGGWFTLRTRALLDNAGADRLADATSDVAQACHAVGIWGDLDGDGQVNSRDALATLSAAVGLSVPPAFDVAGRADVDGDGQVTSRDALLMLSVSIGLSTGGYRVGAGVVDRCAPQVVLPRTLAFVRGNSTIGFPGSSGLAIRAAGDSAVTTPGDSALQYSVQWRPRPSPDGSQIVFVCANPYYYTPGICKSAADGSNPVHLTPAFGNDFSPDWSPDGSQIVFVRSGSVYTMDSTGANQTLAVGAPGAVTSVAWQPVAGSRVIAYLETGIYGEIHTTNLDVASDVMVRQFSSFSAEAPQYVDWDPAGDSIVVSLTVNSYAAVATLAAVAGAALNIHVAWANGPAQQPAWTDQGILFAANYQRYRLFLERPDGSIVQIGPDNSDNYQPGMSRQ